MELHLSYIINLFKGKGDALLRGNYRGLKLQEHVMKVLEYTLNIIIREKVSTDDARYSRDFPTEGDLLIPPPRTRKNSPSRLPTKF